MGGRWNMLGRALWKWAWPGSITPPPVRGGGYLDGTADGLTPSAAEVRVHRIILYTQICMYYVHVHMYTCSEHV